MILQRLEAAGFEAYCVGGCVRDALMDKTPFDWDICTAAKPEQIMHIFDDFQLVTNGLKHGTVTVIVDRKPYEITTFRTDGEYLDNRRPESVVFVKNIEGDLARRDFTVNAMAFSPIHGFADLFGGRKDLAAGIIKCVGDPEKRFMEDALRIMRMLRFAAVLGFEIESKTAAAAIKTKKLLKNIAAERICTEFLKLLDGKTAYEILSEYEEIFAEILFLPFKGDFKAAAKAAAEQCGTKNRLAVLFHMLYFEPQEVKKAAEALKMSRDMTSFCVFVSEHFDDKIPANITYMRKAVGAYGKERMLSLCEIKNAKEAIGFLETIEQKKLCCTLKELNISGGDLADIGISKGKRMGKALERILNDVIEEKTDNEKNSLVSYARRLVEAGEI